MTTTAAKKIKIYKLATELNLSSETIIEFLRKKGFEVKNHMTVVTDPMMSSLMGHFKKEKDTAERHQRKLQEFRSTRKKETPEKAEKRATKEEPASEAVEEPSEAETIEAPAVEVAVEVEAPAAAEVEVEPVEAPIAEKPAAVEEKVVAAGKVHELADPAVTG